LKENRGWKHSTSENQKFKFVEILWNLVHFDVGDRTVTGWYKLVAEALRKHWNLKPAFRPIAKIIVDLAFGPL